MTAIRLNRYLQSKITYVTVISQLVRDRFVHIHISDIFSYSVTFIGKKEKSDSDEEIRLLVYSKKTKVEQR